MKRKRKQITYQCHLFLMILTKLSVSSYESGCFILTKFISMFELSFYFQQRFLCSWLLLRWIVKQTMKSTRKTQMHIICTGNLIRHAYWRRMRQLLKFLLRENDPAIVAWYSSNSLFPSFIFEENEPSISMPANISA